MEKSLFLNNNDEKIATPNAFAAWLDINPYLPPKYPFTVVTNCENSGSCVGLNLSNNGLHIPEDI